MNIEYETLTFINSQKWEEWLDKNHVTTPGIWIKFAKKASGIASIYYQEALEIALCYGWIDGQVKSLDENYYLQKFTPRTKKSIWSQRNVGIVERLIQEKKMQEAGLLAIAAAKADGRWEKAYASPKNIVIPDDFLNELQKDKKAFEFFQALNKSNKYAIVFGLETAKKAETREKRMQKFIEMMKKSEKLY